MRIIEDFTGEKKEMACIGCACTEAGQDVPGYVIETELFHAHHEIRSRSQQILHRLDPSRNEIKK